MNDINWVLRELKREKGKCPRQEKSVSQASRYEDLKEPGVASRRGFWVPGARNVGPGG